MKALKILGMAGISICAFAGSVRADTVTFITTAPNIIDTTPYLGSGNVTVYGPGVFVPGEIGGEFLFKINSNATGGLGSLQGNNAGNANVVTENGSTLFKTFCIDTIDEIRAGDTYEAELETIPPGTSPLPIHTTTGDKNFTEQMAWVMDHYHQGLLGTPDDDLAAAVQLELWKMESTPGIAVNPTQTADMTAIEGLLALASPGDLATSAQNVGVLTLYKAGLPHTQENLLQTQAVFVNANATGTTPLPSVAWAGLASLGAFAGMNRFRKIIA